LKHAGPDALATLAPLLKIVRAHPSLTERTPGSFYRKSKAFLHFHEDASGLFADIKVDGTHFDRYRVSTKAEQAVLIALLASLKAVAPAA
jgi:hypothetical protein